MRYVFLLFVFFAGSLYANSQSQFSKYKYIIVPDVYDFQEDENSYRINDLVEHLFSSKGFVTLRGDKEYPIEYRADRCSALSTKLKRNSKLMSISIQIILVDCNNKVVYTSPWGKSREKDYKKSYHEAIRNAFEDFQQINYQYNSDPEPVIEAVNTVVNSEDEIVEKPIKILYAQPKEDGYQLIDDAPKVVFKIMKTAKQDVFAIEGLNGLLYKTEKGIWMAEYYLNDELITEQLEIKF